MKTKGYKPKKEFTMKQKLTGTALFLLLYRLLSFVPLPFVDSTYIQSMIGMNGSLGLLNVLSGGSLGNMSLMALGIGPWITASIVLQLLGVVFQNLADLNKDEDGKKKYKLITFGTAVTFALAESWGIMLGFRRAGYLLNNAWYAVLVPALLMMAGTGLLSLMGWYMDEKLFGNGTSMILTTGILCSYVSDGTTLAVILSYGKNAGVAVILCILAIVALILLFAYTVFISSCEKRIHVVYSRKMSYGNNKSMSTIPMKLISGGVVPVIFASTIITFPALIGSVAGWDGAWLRIFNTSWWLRPSCPWASIGFVVYIILIVGFSYFCQMMYTNPAELAENLKKSGGMVAGVRPGKPTSDYIKKQGQWFTALGGLFLCVIAAIPMLVSGLLGVSHLSFLGTSILITVSTLTEAWDTWKSQKLSDSYRMNGANTRRIF